jgi:NAD(P)-dependent dehydrogenase (short-subunit alcohol dehydrogenase family)
MTALAFSSGSAWRCCQVRADPFDLGSASPGPWAGPVVAGVAHCGGGRNRCCRRCSNRGIGRELTRLLALRGDVVVLTARDLTKAERAAADLPGHLRVLTRRLEVTDPASIQQVAADLERRHGRLDVLVNNAAIHDDSWQRADTADLQTVREALEVNLVGAWQTALTPLPLLHSSGHGRIVNVSSEAGSLASMDGGPPAYTVSKAALNALTRLLAGELRRDRILVNAVCPGWVATDMGGAADARWPRAQPASCGPSTCPTTGRLAGLPRRPPDSLVTPASTTVPHTPNGRPCVPDDGWSGWLDAAAIHTPMSGGQAVALVSTRPRSSVCLPVRRGAEKLGITDRCAAGRAGWRTARVKGPDGRDSRRHRAGAGYADGQAGVRGAIRERRRHPHPGHPSPWHGRRRGGQDPQSQDPQSQGQGSGSGFAIATRPVGAFVIRNGELNWRPAVHVTRIALGGQVVAVVAPLTIRAIIKTWVKAKR